MPTGGLTICEPLPGLLPLQLPPAVHDEGLLVTFQLSVDVPPEVIVAGFKLILITGVANTVRVALALAEPAEFEQAKV